MSKVMRYLVIAEKRSKYSWFSRKLIFGRMIEVHKGINTLCWK